MHQFQFDHNEETMEDLGRKSFKLIQSKSGFRFGEDTVLLSYFASMISPVRKKETVVLELGANCGAASILLSSRRPDMKIDAVEILPEAYRLFERNVRLNGQEKVIRPILRDIRELPDQVQVKRESYDLVFVNPPYQIPGRGVLTKDGTVASEKQKARFELNGDLSDFLRTASDSLKPQGFLALIHRAVRLPEVIYLMTSRGIEPMLLRMIHPTRNRQATAFLISGRKDGKPGGFIVGNPLILRDDEGCLSQEMREIYSEEN